MPDKKDTKKGYPYEPLFGNWMQAATDRANLRGDIELPSPEADADTERRAKDYAATIKRIDEQDAQKERASMRGLKRLSKQD